MDANFKYPIGTTYTARGARKDLCTVEDHLTTRNSAGEIVEKRYVVSHLFLGQKVTQRDVVETTIARALAT